MINQSYIKRYSKSMPSVWCALFPSCVLKKRTQGLPSGTQIEFLTDDPSGRRDLQTLCKLTGHRIEWIREEDAGVIRYRICLA